VSRQIQAALFDLDGVICFTDKYHYLSWKLLADERGWDFDEELNHRLRGIPRMASLQVILDHNGVELSAEEKETCCAAKNAYYHELIQEMGQEDLYPGVARFLRALRREGVRLGLCSSSGNAALVLDRLGLTPLFGAVVTVHDVERAKPAPDLFLRAAARLGVAPERCVVFEDAEAGVEAARAAGMAVVGVGPPEAMPGAPVCIQDYAEVDVEGLLETGRPFPPPSGD
jgi:beta-phosphoglucomutase